ncbi:MAG: ATP-binding cassette domain-containing protein [Thermogemmatispora sp.]|uniref:ABC transporter ATP-binding protein n=1 Tax=Thermogemmatispora sp. TaxID=1968838 RepID=UPI001D2F57C6|nr:ABC transporter ATP-binding protein [Thermogemmatispora sp.]MBX5451543.1 ATP-binding cassette domain-containing protein [Thermogemmatispora sp.]
MSAIVAETMRKTFFSIDIAWWRSNWRICKRIIGLLRPYWLASLGAVISMILATVAALVVPWLLAWVIDVGIRGGQFHRLLLAAAAILVISALRGLFSYGQSYLSQAVSCHVAYDLRNQVYDHLQRLDFSFHDDAETGQLMSRLTVDIEGVRNFIPLGLLRALVAIVTFGAVAIILLQLDIFLALITLISVPLLMFLAVQVGKRLRPLWEKVQEENGVLGTIMQESLSGIRIVKSFAREPFEVEKYDRQNRKLRELNLETMRLSAWNQPLMVLILNLITVLLVWVGGVAVVGHHLSLGTLVAVTQYVLVLGTPTRTLGFMVTWFMRGISSAARIFEILDTPPAITEAPGAHELRDVRGHVRYEHVSFAYAGGQEVLHDISIEARPGEIVAILGATGAGKSTLLHLLPRFYDVTAGRITIDGYDIRTITLASLRRAVGLVLQDVFLFNATLRENIAYGVEEVNDEQIIAAAKIARIHDFICSLPNGYDTWVGERGVTLSGGQKQRIAIARTLLLNPPILILDDSTSSVDMETEYLIQQALEAVMRGRTTFVVASRLRTIKHAHRILILDRGRIVEEGTHESLLARNGLYRRLYDLQLREQEEFEERYRQQRAARQKSARQEEGQRLAAQVMTEENCCQQRGGKR